MSLCYSIFCASFLRCHDHVASLQVLSSRECNAHVGSLGPLAISSWFRYFTWPRSLLVIPITKHPNAGDDRGLTANRGGIFQSTVSPLKKDHKVKRMFNCVGFSQRQKTLFRCASSRVCRALQHVLRSFLQTFMPSIPLHRPARKVIEKHLQVVPTARHEGRGAGSTGCHILRILSCHRRLQPPRPSKVGTGKESSQV